jgi:putative ABC transport system substrate-binding protein
VINRRNVLTAIGAGALASPLALFAQGSPKMFRVGFLSSESPVTYGSRVAEFKKGLVELGYVEGRNLVIEYRWAAGKNELLSQLASELIQVKVDAIVTHGSLPTRAARDSTARVPIVFAITGDVVAMGVVTNLARPGGNMTGSTFFYNELNAKRIELLKETLPDVAQIGVVLDANNPANPTLLKTMQATARQLKVMLHEFPVQGRRELDGAFAAMLRKRVDAVVLAESPMAIANSTALAEFSAKSKLPSIGFSEVVEAGGLISYGVNTLALWHRAAYFVDKILKGTKPGDIPIEQPTKFELIVNLKSAKALGIKIPNSILVRADKVIEA